MPVDLDKILFEAPSFSHFFDMREAPKKILNKKTLLVRDVVTEAVPVLKTMAREYLFLEGKYVDYQQILSFIKYIENEMK